MAAYNDCGDHWASSMYMVPLSNANLNALPVRPPQHPSAFVNQAGLGYIVANGVCYPYAHDYYAHCPPATEFQSPAEALSYVYCPPPNYVSPYNPYNPFIPGAVVEPQDILLAEPQQNYLSSASYPCYPVVAQPALDASNTSSLLNTRGLLSTMPGNSDASRYSLSQTSVDSTFPASFKPFYPSKSTDKAQNLLSPLKPAALHRTPSHASANIPQPISQVCSGSGHLPPNENLLQGNGPRPTYFGSSMLNDNYPRQALNNRRNGNPDMLGEQNRGPRSGRSGGQSRSSIVVKSYTSKADNADENGNIRINPNCYNRAEFPVKYPNAKFFVIKSYSEDDVHKSIKYNVWSSTPSGNKRLDVAYEDAQKISGMKKTACPVFLFFSVNASGQFCGVAEMAASVDFRKDMDFWQQDKWSGSLPVKWHIVKDVANSNFRHIILENNENKAVTNSRDTQEVPYKAGLSMLSIFKESEMKTCVIDDFYHYEERQRIMYEDKCASLGKNAEESRQAKSIITVGSMAVTI